MERLLNTNTETVHERDRDGDATAAACGSLGIVPETHIQVVSVDEVETVGSLDRCGRCFDDGGGY